MKLKKDIGEILYLTAETPYGKGEYFTLEEMVALKELGVNLLIIPRSPMQSIFHNKGNLLQEETVKMPLVSFRILIQAFMYLFSQPIAAGLILLRVIRDSRSTKIKIKNIAVYPKSLYLARMLRNRNILHIHAHWGTTPSTIAYIVSTLLNVPWSLTLHRGDIKENNMLLRKITSASFVRCISQHGKNMTLDIVGNSLKDKIKVIPMGAAKDCIVVSNEIHKEHIFTIVTPANLIPVKGHRYLIDACAFLRECGINDFSCCFCGDGELRMELESYIQEKGLEHHVRILGQLPHEKLMELYGSGVVDAVVLPSIQIDGEHEGIPVSLMEAMTWGIPVISTNTGGIPELLGEGGGIVVDEKNSRQLAAAIERLVKDPVLSRVIGAKGKIEVDVKYNLLANTQKLLLLFGANPKKSTSEVFGIENLNKGYCALTQSGIKDKE